MSTQERRGFARLYVGVEAVYTRKDKNPEEKVLVQDISLSGVRFISTELLEAGTELEFSLSIPDIPVRIIAVGKVVWQKKFSESFFDTGIDFIAMDSQVRDVLANYISGALGRVEEHREFVRCNLSTMINYRRLDMSCEENRCVSEDISPTGMKVFMKELLGEGTQLALSFCLPESNEPICAQGKLIWVRTREEKFYEAGLEFVKIDNDFVEKINAYVKKTLGISW